MSDFYQWKEQKKISSIYQKISNRPVAYFCMEFALPDNLPIYAGGLGILAGDYVMEAHQQSFPMIAVGLFYSEKCIPDEAGGYCIANDPEKLGLIPVVDREGERVKVKVPVGQSDIVMQAWLYNNGTIPVYLLDTNIPENKAADRKIFRLLYIADPETRLKQELLLGIGGTRLLQQIDINPSIFHMNEGHSAFLSFELASRLMQSKKLEFESAFQEAKKTVAFTNHTLVVGGHDVFDNKLVLSLISRYADKIGVKADKLIEKGSDQKNKKVFSATFLALNAAGRINAVSMLHAREARKLWPDYSTVAVTNGVNVNRWDKIHDGAGLTERHRQNKKILLERIRKETGVKWKDNELLLGWARRIVAYKRPESIFEDMAGLKKLLNNRKQPVHLVFSGQPHYNDSNGVSILDRIKKLSQTELKGNLVFLDGYSSDISSLMIAGCDVWLNTPIVGLEACGTSGMKASLNGALACSTNDGWLPEVDLDKIGFKLDDKYITLSLLDTLGNRIIPLYYQFKNNSQISSIWKEKMEWSREAILHQFGSDRMLRDYTEKIYKPLLADQPAES